MDFILGFPHRYELASQIIGLVAIGFMIFCGVIFYLEDRKERKNKKK